MNLWCLISSVRQRKRKTWWQTYESASNRGSISASEFITVVSPPTKKFYVEVPHIAPVLNIPPPPRPSVDAIGPDHVPAMRSLIGKYAHPERGEASIGSAPINDDLDRKDVSASPRPQTPRVPSWEEMVELLKQVPYFTKVEPPVTNMGDFFPLTKRVTVDLDDNPPISCATQLPYGTLESVVSRIRTIQDYTIIEIVKVVSFVSL